MTYTTQPGTVAHRAVEHLRTLAAGTEISSAELADALDIDQNGLAASLEYAKRNGAIRGRKDGRLMRWSLGDGTPPPLPDDYEPDAPLRRKADEAVPIAPPPPLFKPREPEPDRPPARAPSTARGEFDVAVWASGGLTIRGLPQQQDGTITLTPEQATAVKRLISRVVA